MVVHTKRALVLAMSVVSAATLSSLTSAAVLEEVVVSSKNENKPSGCQRRGYRFFRKRFTN